MIGNGTKIKTVRTKPRRSDWLDRQMEKKYDKERERKRREKRETDLDSGHRDYEGR
jgi:hypothetical protein